MQVRTKNKMIGTALALILVASIAAIGIAPAPAAQAQGTSEEAAHQTGTVLASRLNVRSFASARGLDESLFVHRRGTASDFDEK